MVKLSEIVSKLDIELDIKSFGKDSAFSQFIPMVYEPLKFDWKSVFEKDFVELFNGLMLKGDANVKKIFLAVFPTDEVLERFLFAGTREGGSRKACLASKGDETDELIYSTSEMVHLDLV